MNKTIFFFILGLIFLSFACTSTSENKNNQLDSNIVQGPLIILHDYAMEASIKEMAQQFQEQYPHVEIVAEPNGSRNAAMSIMDRNKACDIFISSDYLVINTILIPKETKYVIQFATDELVIAFTPESTLSDSISTENWFRVLLDPGVHYGRVDPDFAPIGYRTAICMKLAEKYFGEFGIKDQLIFKDKEFIVSTDQEALDLVRKHDVDYIFTYKSNAEQHQLKYIQLPDQMNFSKDNFASYYAMGSVKVGDRYPGKYIIHTGIPIRYGLSVIKDAPNPKAAEAFIAFFTNPNQGLKILKKNHIMPLDSLRVIPNDSMSLVLRSELGI